MGNHEQCGSLSICSRCTGTPSRSVERWLSRSSNGASAFPAARHWSLPIRTGGSGSGWTWPAEEDDGVSPSSPGNPSFAYLLLTHKDARHVEGLADRILDLSPGAQIVVHHDAGANDLPWRGAPSGPIHLVERSRVKWGDWSMIEATLRM